MTSCGGWNASSTTASSNSTSPTPVIWVVTFKLDNEFDRFVNQFNFWIQALLVKLVPCCGLTILSAMLIRALKVAEQRRQMLRGRDSRDDMRARTNARTTRMLLVVVVLFLVTEFPQGVINFLNGLLESFVDEVYASLGDLLDILALINNGINFFLYCSMSKQFRDTFIQLFFAGKCCRCLSSLSSSHRADCIMLDTDIPLDQLRRPTGITLLATTSTKPTERNVVRPVNFSPSSLQL